MALPLERDVIKFVIPKLDQETPCHKTQELRFTGGSSGIGLATAKRFVAEGAYVFITGRRQTELDAAVNEIGKTLLAFRAMSQIWQTSIGFTPRSSKSKVTWMVFANAGVGQPIPLGSITEEHFDKTFNTNVKGLLFTVQKALPLIPEGASIILNASTVLPLALQPSACMARLKLPCDRLPATGHSTLKNAKFG